MNIPVIFEDVNILVINKPSGLVVHPFDYSDEYTLVDFLSENYPGMFTIDNSVTLQDKRIIKLGGIVHKLDRDTSGVMVIAKNTATWNELKKQFREHLTKKVYIAVVEGNIDFRPSHEFANSNAFTIDAPLGRGKKEYKQSTNPVNPRGELREAVTDVKVLERGERTSLVELSPKTGRTHQLRAHMSSINHPIVGDKAYGSKIESERIMLHAQSLSFSVNGKEYSFEVKENNF